MFLIYRGKLIFKNQNMDRWWMAVVDCGDEGRKATSLISWCDSAGGSFVRCCGGRERQRERRLVSLGNMNQGQKANSGNVAKWLRIGVGECHPLFHLVEECKWLSGLASLAHWTMGREIVVLFFKEPYFSVGLMSGLTFLMHIYIRSAPSF